MLLVDSIDLFASAPYTLAFAPRGEQVVMPADLNILTGGSTSLGALEPALTVHGTLSASTAADLWSLYQSILAQITSPPTPVDLVDDLGRTHTGYAFVQLRTPAGMRAGRVWSMPFEALFIKFK